MTTDAQFDAVVVGAGPAGSCAAYEIARAGFSVLLVEKHKMIGVPVCCAEGITHHGLTSVVPLEERWICSRVEGIICHSPTSEPIKIHHPQAGYILDRKIFDRDLAARAAGAGAVVRVNTEVTGIEASNGDYFDRVRICEDGNEFSVCCKIIIGCDGIESLVGRWAGLDTVIAPQEMDITAQYLLGDVPDLKLNYPEFHLSAEFTPGGYAWVFPKSTTTANVGLGYSPAELTGGDAFRRLDQFIKRRFGSRNMPVLEKTAGGLSIFKGRKLMMKKNVLLAGDAARVFDSLTGAGIANALLSGKYAGQTAAEYLAEAKPKLSLLKCYPERFMKAKGRDLRFMLYTRNIFIHMTDDDYRDVLDYLRPQYHEQTIYAVEGIKLIKGILRNRPRLLTLARHLVW